MNNQNNKKLTYQKFINLLKAKDKEFSKIFWEVLNNVTYEFFLLIKIA
jgi:hypothetical protein